MNLKNEKRLIGLLKQKSLVVLEKTQFTQNEFIEPFWCLNKKGFIETNDSVQVSYLMAYYTERCEDFGMKDPSLKTPLLRENIMGMINIFVTIAGIICSLFSMGILSFFN